MTLWIILLQITIDCQSCLSSIVRILASVLCRLKVICGRIVGHHIAVKRFIQNMDLKTVFAFDPKDTDEIRLEKFAILLVAGSCCLAGCIWTAMYYYIFGIGLTAILPFCFVIIVGTSLLISHLSKNHHYAVYAQIICIIYITTFIQWSIGGVFDSGYVLAWAFLGPIIALMFFSFRQSFFWLSLYLVNLLITVMLNGFFVSQGQEVAENTKILFFIMNLSFSSIVVFIFAGYFVASAIREREKANKLLLNILPEKIAHTLKQKEGVIANQHTEVSILFADLVGFTHYSSSILPEELVSRLDEIFLRFDDLSDHYGLEKIKTIGDAYMVVGGLPEPKSDHTLSIASMAIDMLSVMKRINQDNGTSLSLRIGIHTGPVVAGVIGKRKFAYDLWGDTVNVASRMESSGKPDLIQVSENVYQVLKDEFQFERRGRVEIKGKGPMDTYYLIASA